MLGGGPPSGPVGTPIPPRPPRPPPPIIWDILNMIILFKTFLAVNDEH